jgi:hypothetical protein
MKRCKFWNWTFAITLAAGLFVISDAKAQSVSSAKATATSLGTSSGYSVAKEIKIEGTIQSIQAANSGALRGTHAQIETAKGLVDVHLGVSPNVNAKTLNLSAGDAVEITGMMTTEGGSNVLLARILTTPSRIFILRSERGVPTRGISSRSSSTFGQAAKGAL